jgi:hypothetical protein
MKSLVTGSASVSSKFRNESGSIAIIAPAKLKPVGDILGAIVNYFYGAPDARGGLIGLWEENGRNTRQEVG